MFDRSWSFLTSFAAIALLPLAIQHADQTSSFTTHAIDVSFKARPVHIGVQVATVTRPLDLDALTTADFGDSELVR
ncbi:MAG TPA: hypothetical protein PLD46_08795 [Hyphomicrobium sp.]|nr:hypothetical protein [Hyphomicrobium sp.]